MRVVLLGERPGVFPAVERLGLEAVVVAPDADGVVACREGPVAAVVALTERAVLPAARLRAALGVPGTPPAVALRCHDKVCMKEAVSAAGLPCTGWERLDAATDMAAVVARLGLPLVVKQIASSGSRGLVVARDLAAALRAPRDGYLAERFLDGVEMSVESFVADGEVLFTNPTEYFVPRFANIAPAVVPPETLRAVLDLNRRAIAALGIERGLTHCEIYVTGAGPVFGELALRPPGGRLMRLLRRAYGFDPWRALLEVELGRRPELPREARQAAGVWMLHPGAGRVAAVEGVDAARAVPGVHRVVCRVGPGDVVPVREGTGQDIGFIEASGPTRDAVAETLRRAHALVRIGLEA